MCPLLEITTEIILKMLAIRPRELLEPSWVQGTQLQDVSNSMPILWLKATKNTVLVR